MKGCVEVIREESDIKIKDFKYLIDEEINMPKER
jgi:hypothetical protein